MSEPFLAEIMIVGFNFAPRGWAQCNGQILPINQNQSLFSLLGTTYGGDGRTSFALPDLRGRTPIHEGTGGGVTYGLGNKGGDEAVTLSVPEMPSHDHVLKATSDQANTANPTNNLLAKGAEQIYRAPNTLVAMDAAAVTTVGGGQGHDNMQPYLTLAFVIALQGLFPSRN